MDVNSTSQAGCFSHPKFAIFPNFSWQTLPKMQTPRADFGVVWVPDGRIFAIGGNTGPDGTTATVEMLDCCDVHKAANTGTWSYVAPLPTARQCHAVTFLEGKIIVAGGIGERGVECFSLPSSVNKMGQWTSIYPLPKPMNLLALLPVDFGFIGTCKTPSCPYLVAMRDEILCNRFQFNSELKREA